MCRTILPEENHPRSGRFLPPHQPPPPSPPPLISTSGVATAMSTFSRPTVSAANTAAPVLAALDRHAKREVTTTTGMLRGGDDGATSSTALDLTARLGRGGANGGMLACLVDRPFFSCYSTFARCGCVSPFRVYMRRTTPLLLFASCVLFLDLGLMVCRCFVRCYVNAQQYILEYVVIALP